MEPHDEPRPQPSGILGRAMPGQCSRLPVEPCLRRVQGCASGGLYMPVADPECRTRAPVRRTGCSWRQAGQGRMPRAQARMTWPNESTLPAQGATSRVSRHLPPPMPIAVAIAMCTRSGRSTRSPLPRGSLSCARGCTVHCKARRPCTPLRGRAPDEVLLLLGGWRRGVHCEARRPCTPLRGHAPGEVLLPLGGRR